jgi:hypothetical protein
MPLDHYVSQVHLRGFCSPELRNRIYATRKSDLKSFTPRPEDVCRIEDGSTNSYLRHERAIEEFLKAIEPKYNASIKKLAEGKIDAESIYTIAGFTAYVTSCSPTGMRVQTGPLKDILEDTARVLDEKGLIPPPPSVLGGTSLTDVLNSGAVKIRVDEKYPQAIGISTIIEQTGVFGNFKWEVLRNRFEDCPFFTSDFPVAIEKTSDPLILNRIVSLGPNLAVRMMPDPSIRGVRASLSFANFGYLLRDIGRSEVVDINRLIVRCAEDLVFYRGNAGWVASFVAKNRGYRIELESRSLASQTGTLRAWTQTITRLASPEEAHG